MKRLASFLLSASLLVWGNSQTEAGPKYASAKTKEVIEQMINAHGGMVAWRSAKTVSFQYTIFFAPAKLWFNQFEMTEKGTFRTYQDIDAPEKAQLSWDGQKAWSVGITEGEPPLSRVNFHFTTLSLPWLTQDEGTKLSEPGTGKLPGDDAEYITVEATLICRYSCTTDGSHAKYLMFIDQKSYLVKGVQYYVTYGAFLDVMGLPKEVRAFGPMTHVYSRYEKVDGLMIPKEYVTYNPKNEPVVYHLVYDFSLRRPFDKSRMVMPANAVVDTSSPARAKN